MKHIIFTCCSLWISIARVISCFTLKLSKSDLFFELNPNELSYFFANLDRVGSAAALVQLLTGFSVYQILAGEAYAPVSGRDNAMSIKFMEAYVNSANSINHATFDKLVDLVKTGSELCDPANQNRHGLPNQRRCIRNPYGSLLNLHVLTNLSLSDDRRINVDYNFAFLRHGLNYPGPSLSQLSFGSLWFHALPVKFDQIPNFAFESILKYATIDPQLGPIVGICKFPILKQNATIVNTALQLFPKCLPSLWATNRTSYLLMNAAFPIKLSTPLCFFKHLLQNWSALFGDNLLDHQQAEPQLLGQDLIMKFVRWLVNTVGKLLDSSSLFKGNSSTSASNSQYSALSCLFYIICYRTQVHPDMNQIFLDRFFKSKQDANIHNHIKSKLSGFNLAESLTILWSMAKQISDSPVIYSRYRLILLQVELFISYSYSTPYIYGIEYRITEMAKSIKEQMGPSVLDLVNFFNYFWATRAKFCSFDGRSILPLFSAALENNRQFRETIIASPYLPKFHFDKFDIEPKLAFFTNHAQWNFYHNSIVKGLRLKSFVQFQASFPISVTSVPLHRQYEVTCKFYSMIRSGYYGKEGNRQFILFALEYIMNQWFYIHPSDPNRSIALLTKSFTSLTLSKFQSTLQHDTHMPKFGLMHPLIWSLLARVLEQAFAIGQCIPYRFDPKLLSYMDSIQSNGQIYSTVTDEFVALFRSQITTDAMRNALKLLTRQHTTYPACSLQSFYAFMKGLTKASLLPHDGQIVTPDDLLLVAHQGIATFINESKQLIYINRNFTVSSMIESLYCKE